MSRFHAAAGAAFIAFLASSAWADPTPVSTQVLGPFTGHDAPLHPDNLAPKRLAYYGTDLGFTYVHKGTLHFLFGDTASDEALTPISPSTGTDFDDSFGTVDLAAFPDASKFAPGNLPLVKFGQNPGTNEVAGIDPGRPLELFKTPLGGFSNGAREYGVFFTAKPQSCRKDADCDDGLTCDTELGFVGNRPDDPRGLTLACFDTMPGCTTGTFADPKDKASGFCSDRTSSAWTNTPRGRAAAMGLQVIVGERNASDPRKWGNTLTWRTNKFNNVMVQPVQDFVPGRAQQDYNVAGAAGENRRVFLFGRPGFIGVRAKSRTLGLYVAYVDMPKGAIDWKPNYFAGTDAKGVPRWTRNQLEAAAVDLDSSRSGVQSEELIDIVDQQSVVWIDHLGKWVMFFGGGMASVPMAGLPTCGLLELFVVEECKDVASSDGAVYMRSADNPWGPWTPAKVVISGGNPAHRPLEGLYAPGGVMFHPACEGKSCVGRTHSPQLPEGDYGFLYAANIIAPWTRPVGKSVDVIWNVSTWDPYRVVLMRTRIDP